MTSRWRLVVPEAGTNLITNPSFETNTTGWATSLATLTRVSTQSRRGSWSGQVAPTADLNAGASYAVSVTNGQPYTFSVDVKGVAGVPYRVDLMATALIDRAEFIGTGTWQRIVVSGIATATGSGTLWVRKNNSADTNNFYIDGAMLQNLAYETTYFDGSFGPAYAWTGTAHASTSTRSNAAIGGRMYDPLTDNNTTIRLATAGTGMAPVQVVTIPYAYGDGARYQRTRAQMRPIVLDTITNANDQDDLYRKRQWLIDLLKPDAASDPIRYLMESAVEHEVLIPIRYESGLEGSGQLGTMVDESQIRLIAHDPYWRELEQPQQLLDSAIDGLDLNYQNIVMRTDGVWAGLGTGGCDNDVYALAFSHKTGHLYAGGIFLNAGGIAATRIARWDGAVWSALGSGVDASMQDIAIAANGDVYAGGAFLNAGGAGANRIARWNGSAWAALGTGLNGTANAVVVGPDGSVYAGGSFTTAGGGAANRVAKWDGSAWSALGSGVNNVVWALAIGPDGSLYAAGDFTTAGGGAANRVAKWNGSAWSALGDGFGASVRTLAVGADGSVYAGGLFTTSGSNTINRVARWTGAAWYSLATGMDAAVYTLALSPDGQTLYAGGAFTTAGGVSLPDHAAQWNGSSWLPLDTDISLGVATTFWAIATSGTRVAVGHDKNASTMRAASVQSVANPSSASAYPIIVINGNALASAPLRVFQINNLSTGDTIYFTNLVVQLGEVVTIDLRPGVKTVTSNWRGNLFNLVAPGSKLTSWRLLPGNNTLSVYCNQTLGGVISYTSDIRHWGVEGGTV